MADNGKMEALRTALIEGKQIYGCGQYINYTNESDKGYLCCDTPECCDHVFYGLEAVMNYINNEWKIGD